MTYTKGPWTLTLTDDEYKGKHTITDADGEELMCDMNYYPWCPDSTSDWHLIAAAPELLEALKELYNAIDSCVDLTPEVMQKCSKALNKAKGNTQ